MTTVSAHLPPAQMNAVKNAAKDFEAVFISEMFSHMFAGEETDTTFGGGRGEKMFKSMLVNEYGKQLAHGKGIGLSDQIQKAMIDMQHKANGARQ